MTTPPPGVLILCTGNSARSQLAETILRRLSGGRLRVESAGSAPLPDIHPMARATARRLLESDMDGQHPKKLDVFLGDGFDFVITVCDHAAEVCPVFPGAPRRVHWSLPDPAEVRGSEQERQQAFDDTARDLQARFERWLAEPDVRRRMLLEPGSTARR